MIYLFTMLIGIIQKAGLLNALGIVTALMFACALMIQLESLGRVALWMALMGFCAMSHSLNCVCIFALNTSLYLTSGHKYISGNKKHGRDHCCCMTIDVHAWWAKTRGQCCVVGSDACLYHCDGGKQPELQVHAPRCLWNPGRGWHKGDVPLGESGLSWPGAREGCYCGVSCCEWHNNMQGWFSACTSCNSCTGVQQAHRQCNQRLFWLLHQHFEAPEVLAEQGVLYWLHFGGSSVFGFVITIKVKKLRSQNNIYL